MRSSHALGRSVFPVVAFLTLAVSAPAQQILEVYADSLTTYLPAATTVNGVRPLVSQHGVNIDGSWRSSHGLAMQLAGNPSENAWTGKQTDGLMRIDVGGYAQMDMDVALPTTGLQFAFGRTFNSLQVNSGGSSISSNWVCGINWASTAMPEIVLYTHPSDSTKDVVYLVYGADRFLEFNRTTDGGSNQFKGKNGAAGAFDYAANGAAADTDTLTDQVGNRFVFFGFDGASAGKVEVTGTIAYRPPRRTKLVPSMKGKINPMTGRANTCQDRTGPMLREGSEQPSHMRATLVSGTLIGPLFWKARRLASCHTAITNLRIIS